MSGPPGPALGEGRLKHAPRSCRRTPSQSVTRSPGRGRSARDAPALRLRRGLRGAGEIGRACPPAVAPASGFCGAEIGAAGALRRRLMISAAGRPRNSVQSSISATHLSNRSPRRYRRCLPDKCCCSTACPVRASLIRTGTGREPVTIMMADGEVLVGECWMAFTISVGMAFSGQWSLSAIVIRNGRVQFVARGPMMRMLCRGKHPMGHGNGECQTFNGAVWATGRHRTEVLVGRCPSR